MTRPIRLLALAALCLFACASAHAEKWALLIGINHYEDSNNIASLGAADNDARELKKVLKSQLGFPEANITLLVSDGDTKPTRSNIVEALGNLSQNAVAGDTVFVFYSGHGVELQNKSCLLPYDFRGKIAFTGIETALEVSKFNDQHKQIKAKALIMVWDMCRNDPFSKGKGADSKRNVLKNPKGWGIVAADTRARGNDAPVVANFFACSSGETSFEWTDKNRGYFAYFLEKGIKGEAADAQGNITLGSLAKYVQKNVPTVTKNNEGQAQTPYPEFGGAGANEFVLATGKVNPNAEERPAAGVKALSTLATLTFSGQPAGAKILVDRVPAKGTSWSVDLLEATKEVTVTVAADGYRPKLLSVTLERGRAIPIDATLERAEAEKAPDPRIEPGNAAPPPSAGGSVSEAIQRVLQAHNAAGLFALPTFDLIGTRIALDSSDASGDGTSVLLVQNPAANKFRLEYKASRTVRAGYNGQSFWKIENGKPAVPTNGEMYTLNPCQMLWHLLRRFPKFVLDPAITKDKKGNFSIGGTDDKFPGVDFLIFITPDNLIESILTTQGTKSTLYQFSQYRKFGSVSLPCSVSFTDLSGGKSHGSYMYAFERFQENAARGTESYFSGADLPGRAGK